MKSSKLVGVLLAVVITGGGALYVVTSQGWVPTNSGQVQTSTQSQPPSSQGSPTNLEYDCAKPAIQSQYVCDQLPPGYKIAPRLPVAPQAQCSSQMTQSACALLKQTFGNGVCDPNETVWTSPLDCGCGGASVGDPYTGRCGTPATVCQIRGIGG